MRRKGPNVNYTTKLTILRNVKAVKFKITLKKFIMKLVSYTYH